MVNHYHDYEADDLEILFEVENTHFWFKTRKERILSILKRYVSTGETVLELGAGTGNVASVIKKAGYDVFIGDVHFNGLLHAKKYGIDKCCCLDLFYPPFFECFNAVAMFDVLEHLNSDLPALETCCSLLKNRGWLVLTVPAFNFLWSRADACGHKRRYTKKGLKKIVEKAGFRVEHAAYFFSFIMPLLILRRFLLPDNGRPLTSGKYGSMFNLPPVINCFLLAVSRLENRLAHVLPDLPGGSIILVAQKK